MNNLLGLVKTGSNHTLIIKVFILILGLILGLFLVDPVNSTQAATSGDCSGNNLPSAKFSPLSPNINLGETVIFDGSESSDPDGHTLTYEWSVRRTNETATGSTFSFTPTQIGSYYVQLDVVDECWGHGSYFNTLVIVGGGGSSPSQCAGNSVPQAVIDPAGSFLNLGDSITFSALNSSDADNDPLSYEWLVDGLAQSSSSELTLSPTSAGDFVVTLKAQDQCGQGEVSANLTVTDSSGIGGPPAGSGSGGSSGGSVLGTSSGSGGGQCSSSIITAIAGDDISVLPGEEFVLDGSGSPDPGNNFSYTWRINAINFDAQDIITRVKIQNAGVYEAELIVGDACNSDSDTKTITVGFDAAGSSLPADSTDSGAVASETSSQEQMQVLGDLEFVPPAVSPRAGTGLPINILSIAALSGILTSIFTFLYSRKKGFGFKN
jgi:hypothetical protein